jgi:uroporphyrinogen-III decarboxylase
MLMSGCETPPDCPPENVRMMSQAIKDFGYY